MVKKQGYTIAMAGKGGTGKTTLAGLLVRFLKEHEMTPILAVDADANSNLNEVLGLEVEETLGEAREMMKKDVPVGMTKDIFIEMKVEQALVEANGFDLMVMGRPEGPGCYCAANSLLSKFIERMMDNYPYLVVDNEAGMEHFSRLTTKYIDLLLIVSDSSRRGILSARRIYDLVDELNIRVGRKYAPSLRMILFTSLIWKGSPRWSCRLILWHYRRLMKYLRNSLSKLVSRAVGTEHFSLPGASEGGIDYAAKNPAGSSQCHR